MNAIDKMVCCINENRTVIYNLAYRLTGDEDDAVVLISQAAVNLTRERRIDDLSIQDFLAQICRDFTKSYFRNALCSSEKESPAEKLLFKLPPRERIALVLHDVLKLSRTDIFLISGEPEKSFRTHLYRARTLIKDQVV